MGTSLRFSDHYSRSLTLNLISNPTYDLNPKLLGLTLRRKLRNLEIVNLRTSEPMV